MTSAKAPRRPPAPLDQPGLERLALRYVERFATTRARLVRYLERKLRAAGAAEGAVPDPDAIAERFAALGYVDDAGYGAAKAGALARRGLGARRVAQALHAAGLDAETARPLIAAAKDAALERALAYARRRRFGPFGAESVETGALQRQLGAMARAGHDVAICRKVLKMEPEEASDILDVNLP